MKEIFFLLVLSLDRDMFSRKWMYSGLYSQVLGLIDLRFFTIFVMAVSTIDMLVCRTRLSSVLYSMIRSLVWPTSRDPLIFYNTSMFLVITLVFSKHS